LDRLKNQARISLLKRSSWYLTEPVGLEDPEWFINGVVLVETDLAPEELLEQLLGIEKAMGRRRTVKWGPRVIDLDLLCYDRLIVNGPFLTLPHPEMVKRRFVLEPMAEIAPDYLHPVLKRTIAELREALSSSDKGLKKLPD